MPNPTPRIPDHDGRGYRLHRLVGSLRTRVAAWRTKRRADPTCIEFVVAGQQWLHVEASISVIDGAVLVEIDTGALGESRRCRVYVNDGPVFDAVPNLGDHDVEHLAEYLAELRAQELATLIRSGTRGDLLDWPCQEVDAEDLGRDWPLVTLDQVVRWGGTILTEDEIDRVVTAIPKSTIPDAIGEIVAAITQRGEAAEPAKGIGAA